jgi:hypothetical protein
MINIKAYNFERHNFYSNQIIMLQFAVDYMFYVSGEGFQYFESIYKLLLLAVWTDSGNRNSRLNL